MRLPHQARHRRPGFTLVELLVVVAIIGVLAAIALPKLSSTRNRANLASIKSDLRGLVTAEENYFDDNARYAGDIADLQFRGSRGVAITIVEATASGWSATGTNAALAGVSCTIWVGSVSTPSGSEGVPTCH